MKIPKFKLIFFVVVVVNGKYSSVCQMHVVVLFIMINFMMYEITSEFMLTWASGQLPFHFILTLIRHIDPSV